MRAPRPRLHPLTKNDLSGAGAAPGNPNKATHLKGAIVKKISLSSFLIILSLCLALGCAKSNTPASSTENNPSGAAGSDSSGTAGQGGSKSAAASKTKPVEEELTIPSGTVVRVRLDETLSSKSSQAGQSFSATVAEPIVVNGNTVVDKGARARGTVVDA